MSSRRPFCCERRKQKILIIIIIIKVCTKAETVFHIVSDVVTWPRRVQRKT